MTASFKLPILLFVSLFIIAASPSHEQTSGGESTPLSEDIVRLESSGLLSSESNGALGKNLWKGQNRSHITNLMQNLPDQLDLKSAQDLKKRLLLTKANTTLIKNDQKQDETDASSSPQKKQDLFTVRLEKLMRAGLFDDAHKLYHENVMSSPPHEQLAQIGITLLIGQGDVGAACLEEKILSTKYSSSEFWDGLSQTCNRYITNDSVMFQQKVKLQDLEIFHQLPFYERILRAMHAGISYDGVQIETITEQLTPSDLAILLEDPALPGPLKKKLEDAAQQHGLLSKDTPSDLAWNELEKKLSGNTSLDDLIPYAKTISTSRPEEINQRVLFRAIAAQLAATQQISPFWIEKLYSSINENSSSAAYINILQQLDIIDKRTYQSVDNILSSLKNIDSDNRNTIKSLTKALDNRKDFIDNPAISYEKRESLTGKNNYVIPSDTLLNMMSTSAEEQQMGLTVLTTLNILREERGRIPPDVLRQIVKSLLSVGLIEDASAMATEILAGIMNEEKGEL